MIYGLILNPLKFGRLKIRLPCFTEMGGITIVYNIKVHQCITEPFFFTHLTSKSQNKSPNA